MGNFQHVHSAGQPLTWLVGLFLLGRPKTAAAGLLRLVSINAKTPTSRRRGFSAPVLENPLYTAAVVARSMEIEDDTVDVCGDVFFCERMRISLDLDNSTSPPRYNNNNNLETKEKSKKVQGLLCKSLLLPGSSRFTARSHRTAARRHRTAARRRLPLPPAATTKANQHM